MCFPNLVPRILGNEVGVTDLRCSAKRETVGATSVYFALLNNFFY